MASGIKSRGMRRTGKPECAKEQMDEGSRQHRKSTLGRIFLLSPANIAGARAALVLREGGQFELARRLRNAGASLGEVFSFISGLYFRGKLAYAQAFADTRPGVPGTLVITACGGLLPPETHVTLDRLCEISAVDLGLADPRFHDPLVRDARHIAAVGGTNCQFILLGSIATQKYVEPLLEVFGEKLLFPEEFIGRGDLSRGGLMLRCVQTGVELTYVQAVKAVRHGPRPPRLKLQPHH